MNKKILLFALVFVVGCAPAPIAKIMTNSGDIDVFVEIADEPEEIMQGLMFRQSLDVDAGMLFIYNDEQIRNFWMKNTFIPLDIIFINGKFSIVDVKNAVPCIADPCPIYTSNGTAQYVLEVNSGFVKSHNISVRDRVEIIN